jgi:hypothetical protein
LNFGRNGDFLDFLFQDTFNAVLLWYLSDVVGASCWFKKLGKKVATTVDLVLSVTKTDATFYLLYQYSLTGQGLSTNSQLAANFLLAEIFVPACKPAKLLNDKTPTTFFPTLFFCVSIQLKRGTPS